MTKAHQIPPAQCDASYTAAAAMRWAVAPAMVFQEKIDGVRTLLQIRPNGAAVNYLTGRRIKRDTGEFVELQDEHIAWRDHVFPETLANSVIDGEMLHGVFWYFDVLLMRGRSVMEKPLRERLAILERHAAEFPGWMQPVRSSAEPASFLKRILAGGGEGIVRKNLDETYGFDWSKVKLRESYDVVIMRVDPEARSMAVGQWKGRELVELGTVTGLTEQEAATGARHLGEVAEILAPSRDPRGRFYKPTLFRWRADKSPADCTFQLHLQSGRPGQVAAPANPVLAPQVRPSAGPA